VRQPVAPVRTTEEWIDEGPIRDEAIAATERAAGTAPTRLRRMRPVDPDVVADIHQRVEHRALSQGLIQRFGDAADALDRERYDEARRILAPVARQLPDVVAVRELSGLIAYRLGRWKQAIAELEAAHELGGGVEHLPVLADCYRATKRWSEVERVWRELREASPAPAVMAEGRIVAASAAADRGDLGAALRTMLRAAPVPKKVRAHHLRQWYVLADLFDRAGDPVRARQYFELVAGHDPGFVDVVDRLRSLGRR
jgi:tetratricopeptide (TPR) repeat protein